MITDSESIALYPDTTPSRAPTASRSRRSRLPRTAVVLAVVLGTGAGSVAVAQAATTGPNNRSNASAPRTVRTPPAAAGKVATVDPTGDSFTLTEHNGTVVTVDVGSTTTYKDGKVTAPTFSNVKVGEMVSVQGATVSGTVTATSVLIGFGGFRGGFGGGMFGHGTPPAAAGKVATVDPTGDSFTLTEHNGTVVTVDVGSTTTYKDGKVTAPTFSNVKVGEMVGVQGATVSGTVTATSVLIGFGGGMGHNHGWGGRSAPA